MPPDHKVEFYDGSTADAAASYKGYGPVTILNFANGNHPGGGYTVGSSAQEEELCRQYPALYTSLNRAKNRKKQKERQYRKGTAQPVYPFGPQVTAKSGKFSSGSTAVLWTWNIECLRHNKQSGFRLLDAETDEYYHRVNVVSAAAPNIGANEKFDEKEIDETLKNVMLAYPYFRRTHPEVTEDYHTPKGTIILGAWGSGAFRNDASQMAKRMLKAVINFGGHYKKVVFAVPSILGINDERDKTSARNAEVFKRLEYYFCL